MVNENLDTDALIDTFCGMRGPLKAPIRARLKAVVASPSQRTWNESYGLILNQEPLISLWQAMCAVDPAFPRHKASNAPWAKIPSRETLVMALQYAKPMKDESVFTSADIALLKEMRIGL